MGLCFPEITSIRQLRKLSMNIKSNSVDFFHYPEKQSWFHLLFHSAILMQTIKMKQKNLIQKYMDLLWI